MTVLFDLTTPKQVRFFHPVMEELEQRGEKVLATTRRFAETQLLLETLGIEAKVLGSYGGGTLAGKLSKSVERVGLLAGYFQRVKPDVLVTLSNPESCRTAYGLGIPIVCFNDLPESNAVGKLSLPLASKVCVPWIVPLHALAAYGVTRAKLFRYRALDPVAWQERYQLNPEYLEELGLERSRPVVVFRDTEVKATYVDRDIVGAMYREVQERHPDWQLVNVPRYRRHRFYDTGSLLSQADAFVGGGGTMCVEAAYYGTPVVATRDLPCLYMQWLFDRGLAVQCRGKAEAIRELEQVVAERGSTESRQRRARGRRMFARMRFPLHEVVELIQSTAREQRLP